MMSSFRKWDRNAYRQRIGDEEAARRRSAIMAEQMGYQVERDNLDELIADFERVNGTADLDAVADKVSRLRKPSR
ncbi:hypothetical protein ACFWUP_06775 [Nocardia sp. NPDC058658]|uniref:hypothetical protein n=1 Tax=Nocardia sp. NPDC058658 TaxID=3346580 RepID=UPI003664C3DE